MAYIGLTFVPHLDNFWLAAILGGLAVGLVGLAMEQVFLSRLHGQFNEQAVLTVGLVYILANLFLWIWGPYMKTNTISGLVPLFGQEWMIKNKS